MDVITAHVKTELIDSTASDVEVAHFLGILETALGECYAQLEKEIARFETPEELKWSLEWADKIDPGGDPFVFEFIFHSEHGEPVL